MSTDSQKRKSTHKPTKYVISKKTPTAINSKVDPVISESTKNVFVACGNTILVFSLQTGLQVKTLRSRRTESTKETGDMHGSNIVMLAMKEGDLPVLYSLCASGVLAEWDLGDDAPFVPINHTQLDVVGKIRHAVIDRSNNRLIVNEMKERKFHIYDLVTLKL